MNGIRSLSLALAIALAAHPALAERHVALRNDVTDRLVGAAADRGTNEAAVARLLATSTAADAASARGLDIHMLRAGVSRLSDAEVADLAARADALRSDPVAGGGRKTLIIVGIVVAVAVILALLIVESCKEKGAECLDKK
jgi:hypothetical protein